MPKLKILFVFLLLLVGVEFALRGPYRFLVPKSRLNDITYIYVPARAMIQGMDPYDPESFARVCQCDRNGLRSMSQIGSDSSHSIIEVLSACRMF